MATSEKLFLQWNYFQNNVKSAFAHFKTDEDFADVTLACEDGQQLLSHKIVLASSSPFFMEVFKRNKHPHPLIYMRGIKSEDLVAIVDFLYDGEATVDQENLDTFLSLANELKLKGLEGEPAEEKQKNVSNNRREHREWKEKDDDTETKIPKMEVPESDKRTPLEGQAALTCSSTVNVNFEDLDEQVKSMMTRSGVNRASDGSRAAVCTVCGKEGQWVSVRNHVEAHHITGISHSCNLCGKTTGTRHALHMHMIRSHK